MERNEWRQLSRIFLIPMVVGSCAFGNGVPGSSPEQARGSRVEHAGGRLIVNPQTLPPELGGDPDRQPSSLEENVIYCYGALSDVFPLPQKRVVINTLNEPSGFQGGARLLTVDGERLEVSIALPVDATLGHICHEVTHVMMMGMLRNNLDTALGGDWRIIEGPANVGMVIAVEKAEEIFAKLKAAGTNVYSQHGAVASFGIFSRGELTEREFRDFAQKGRAMFYHLSTVNMLRVLRENFPSIEEGLKILVQKLGNDGGDPILTLSQAAGFRTKKDFTLKYPYFGDSSPERSLITFLTVDGTLEIYYFSVGELGAVYGHKGTAYVMEDREGGEILEVPVNGLGRITLPRYMEGRLKVGVRVGNREIVDYIFNY